MVIFGIACFLLICSAPENTDAQTPVAFSAALLTNMPTNTTDTPITFDLIETNVGGAFDGTTFTAPIQGLYFFGFAAKSDDAEVHLRVNNNNVRSALIKETNPDELEVTNNLVSNSIIILLNPSDEVSIYLSSEGSGLFNIRPVSGIYTSFSGALLVESTSPTITGFSAVRTTNMSYAPEDTNIWYDWIQTDEGSNFQGDYFYAPETGLYLFTFSGKGEHMTVHLKLNDNTKRSATTRKYGYDGYGQTDTSSSAVLLVMNDVEATRMYLSDWGSGLEANGPTNGVYIGFSGAMLKGTSTVNHDGSAPSFADNVIAFSAARTTEYVPDPVGEEDEPIDFNVIDTTLGYAFDGRTFTAPYQGYYLFTFAAKAMRFLIHLKVNGVVKRSAIVYDVNYEDNMSSNSAVLLLNVNDEVTVELSDYMGYPLTGTSNADGVFIEFSGVLLYESP